MTDTDQLIKAFINCVGGWEANVCVGGWEAMCVSDSKVVRTPTRSSTHDVVRVVHYGII